MFVIYLSILPIVLLLVNGVTSVDLYKSKRVPRRHTEVIRTYNSNHPPIVENYHDIPVTVIYEHQDAARGRQQNPKRVGIFSEHEKYKLNNAKTGRIALNPETRSVHHPPSAVKYDSASVNINNDYDGESILKPIAPSINIPAHDEKSKRLHSVIINNDYDGESILKPIAASINIPAHYEKSERLDSVSINNDYDGESILKPIAPSINIPTHDEKSERLDSVSIHNDYDGESILKPLAPSINIPIHNEKGERLHSVNISNDYDGESILKPIARSINTPAHNEKDKRLQKPEKSLTETERKTGDITQRSRSQQIRKVKVNKNQLEMYIIETESSVIKTENTVNKEPKNKTASDQTRANEQGFKISKRQEFPKRGKQLRDPIIPIIESESYVFSHSGDFHYSYEGGDGTKAFERGELKSSNGGAGSSVDGGFSYKDKDGNDFSLTYTADENGYRPVGAHLPTPPPIPPAIQRALDYLATKTTPEPITERVKTIKNI